MEIVRKFVDFEIFSIGDFTVRISTLAKVALIILITKLVLWLIKKALFRNHTHSTIDIGNTLALLQIIKYVIWVLATGLLLQAIGINLTVLLAGSAALLVGIGLGLQQTFNDVLSGVILLSERSIKIGDILEIDGAIVRIQKIGLRTSQGLDRDEISVIIPNSSITTNKVINWSHQSEKARFRIRVGVAYGSDMDLVEKILKESALEHPDISDRNSIEVRLADFGDSCLDLQLLFFSKNIFRIEKVKSDIRKLISRKFAENNIAIPFPQMDVHCKANHKNES